MVFLLWQSPVWEQGKKLMKGSEMRRKFNEFISHFINDSQKSFIKPRSFPLNDFAPETGDGSLSFNKARKRKSRKKHIQRNGH